MKALSDVPRLGSTGRVQFVLHYDPCFLAITEPVASNQVAALACTFQVFSFAGRHSANPLVSQEHRLFPVSR